MRGLSEFMEKMYMIAEFAIICVTLLGSVIQSVKVS